MHILAILFYFFSTIWHGTDYRKPKAQGQVCIFLVAPGCQRLQCACQSLSSLTEGLMTGKEKERPTVLSSFAPVKATTVPTPHPSSQRVQHLTALASAKWQKFVSSMSERIGPLIPGAPLWIPAGSVHPIELRLGRVAPGRHTNGDVNVSRPVRHRGLIVGEEQVEPKALTKEEKPVQPGKKFWFDSPLKWRRAE
ncbi:unnamed protein product [Pleuronectes platessa]|uniref:Uncharacterized protein n=1 Tax=Pleuronectes platessa TaxID=8262 RepID=A0A9N7UTS9_PLEPL|nr:unnamed protein product [Pleuronectes platessa]